MNPTGALAGADGFPLPKGCLVLDVILVVVHYGLMKFCVVLLILPRSSIHHWGVYWESSLETCYLKEWWATAVNSLCNLISMIKMETSWVQCSYIAAHIPNSDCAILPFWCIYMCLDQDSTNRGKLTIQWHWNCGKATTSPMKPMSKEIERIPLKLSTLSIHRVRSFILAPMQLIFCCEQQIPLNFLFLLDL